MIVSISMELSNGLILPSSSAEEQIAVLMIKIDLFQIGRMCDTCDRKVKQFFSISIINRVGKEQMQKRILLFSSSLLSWQRVEFFTENNAHEYRPALTHRNWEGRRSQSCSIGWSRMMRQVELSSNYRTLYKDASCTGERHFAASLCRDRDVENGYLGNERQVSHSQLSWKSIARTI